MSLSMALTRALVHSGDGAVRRDGLPFGNERGRLEARDRDTTKWDPRVLQRSICLLPGVLPPSSVSSSHS